LKTPFNLSVNPRLFAFLALGFVLATVVGTVSHELGHYIPAKYYGFEAKLHYASVSYGKSKESKEIITYYEANKAKIQSAKDSPEKEYFNGLVKNLNRLYFLITLGGPVQTMLTGTIGLLLLWLYRKKLYNGNGLNLMGWIAVFLAFFWSRQVLNFLMSVPSIFKARKYYRSDEPQISLYLDLPHWAVDMVTAFIGILLLMWVVFYIIPKQHRFTFICAGLVGSFLGWIVWLETLGPRIMP
jgi:hypothetical protein